MFFFFRCEICVCVLMTCNCADIGKCLIRQLDSLMRPKSANLRAPSLIVKLQSSLLQSVTAQLKSTAALLRTVA